MGDPGSADHEAAGSGVVNHYAVLGVRSDASVVEIRQAWIRAARRWHPDHRNHADTGTATGTNAGAGTDTGTATGTTAGTGTASGTERSTEDAARTDGATDPSAERETERETERAKSMMLAVNEAWRILGDAKLRAKYDRAWRASAKRNSSAAEAAAKTAGGAGGATDYGTVDGYETVDGAAPGTAPEEPMFVLRSRLAVMVVRGLPWLLLTAVVVTILIVTAFISNDRAERENPTPDIEAPTCVRILNDGNVRYVPCASENDGVLDEIVALSPDAICSNPAAVPYEVAANRRLCIIAQP